MRDEKSGAQKRKERAARNEADEAERERLARERRESAYGDIQPPPDNPVGVLAWTHQALARMLFDVLRDPTIGEQERRRFASDLAAKIGMTGPKAVSDARLVALEKKLGVAKDNDSDAADQIGRAHV